ncbi:MAG: MerR family transcriptional regulator [Selenomonadaceae bacterium]|nr:MerR family transcriptional regulator [Selenomonadaceae bacterium]MBR4383899.1 MerR family transcriptional regulator [Selenomonadaceae bacterium]
MTIKDVAERTGHSIYTIRYYVREGLLPGAQRDKNGVRHFTEEDLESIYIIECLKNCDMSIQEIKDFTQWTLAGDSTIKQRLKLFREKYALLQDKLSKLRETLDAVSYKIWFYETAVQAGTVAIHDEMSPEEIPEDMREIRARMKHVERFTNEKFLIDKLSAMNS